MRVNTARNHLRLMREAHALLGTESPATVDATLDDYVDGSLIEGTWSLANCRLLGRISAHDGSTFQGVVDSERGFEGLLRLNGAGCSWLFCSGPAVPYVRRDTGTHLPVGPPLGRYGRVVSMEGTWDVCGSGAGTLTLDDGSQRAVKWVQWLTIA